MRGGCTCGSVRFELAGDPVWVLACHCDSCKKRTGSAYGISAMFENSSVKEFVGETKTYCRTGDSGNQVRYEFCPNCGTTLRWFVDIVPRRQAFAGGTFDESGSLKPIAEMYTDAAAPWARLGCELSRPLAPDDAFRNAMITRTRSVGR
ncbi:MAG TPA: GFA family protein [Burkholderiales bacterium]